LAGQDPIETNADSLGRLLEELRVNRSEAAMVFVNGKRAGFESEIRDGDHISVFPVLGGG
jgi:molybdopterin converting factor small subunit